MREKDKIHREHICSILLEYLSEEILDNQNLKKKYL